MNIRHDHAYILALYERSTHNCRTLLPADEEALSECRLANGTLVLANVDGAVVYVDYGNGMKLKRNQQSIMVASADGAYWYGQGGTWFRLD